MSGNNYQRKGWAPSFKSKTAARANPDDSAILPFASLDQPFGSRSEQLPRPHSSDARAARAARIRYTSARSILGCHVEPIPRLQRTSFGNGGELSLRAPIS
uniref:Uncharacterized protein n=1 Tax=Mycena chlorophos TaxID=658473 RepID=A0ABQ0KZ99_MYCCL|nr:predicted protein [Mycena chlorophos]